MSIMLWTGIVFAVNVVMGAALIAGVFTLMERRITVGAFGGIAVGAGMIYAEATVGEDIFSPTITEMKFLVIAAAAGAVLGVTAVLLAIEPEL
ncbi:hypothetical protein [Halorhabdus amylolytica]|uniref:hypothetical protein n=1 Tax=Halorhabdus amylolytica TaxID=2559573 RepID=UPI0010AA98D6|nr:hypothetical protein [Halorhabdus amylolytica]